MAHKALKGAKSARKVRSHMMQKNCATAKKLQRLENKKRREAMERDGNPCPKMDLDEVKPPAEVAQEGPRLTKKERRAQFGRERQHRELYSADDKILLVGEGNFSFARALCRNLGSGTGVCATAFDNDATLRRKYDDAEEARKDVEDKFDGTTLVGVDATQLHRIKEFRKAFTKVVWNFPHNGSGEADVEKSIADHRKLMTEFFTSASKCLDPQAGSEIHVSLKASEPYKSWKIVQLARAAAPDLQLRNAVAFCPQAFPGYAHRRTAGFHERHSKADSEELNTNSRVYIFAKAPPPEE